MACDFEGSSQEDLRGHLLSDTHIARMMKKHEMLKAGDLDPMRVDGEAGFRNGVVDKSSWRAKMELTPNRPETRSETVSRSEAKSDFCPIKSETRSESITRPETRYETRSETKTSQYGLARSSESTTTKADITDVKPEVTDVTDDTQEPEVTEECSSSSCSRPEAKDEKMAEELEDPDDETFKSEENSILMENHHENSDTDIEPSSSDPVIVIDG